MITVTDAQVDEIAAGYKVTELQVIAAAQNAEQYATTNEEWLEMFANGLGSFEAENK